MKVLKQLGKCVCYIALYVVMQYMALRLLEYGCLIDMYLGYCKSGGNPGRFPVEMANNRVALMVLNLYLPWIIVLAGILTILFLVGFFKLRKKKFTAEVGLRRFNNRHWGAVLLGAVGLCFCVNFGMQLLPIPEDVLMEYAAASEGLMQGPFVVLFLANVVMAPLIEEILFRGLILGRLKQVMPIGGALVLSAIFFGLMHGQILWICYTTLVGLVLGLVAWKTNSTWAPMVMHFAFNLFGTCMGYFVEEISGIVSLVLTIVGVLCLVPALGIMLKSSPESDQVKGTV